MHILQSIPDYVPLALALCGFLAWFIVGIVAGQRVPKSDDEKQGKPQQKQSSGRTFDIYVGNLAYNMRERELAQTFEKYGEVTSVRIIRHKLSGKSKGFAFVSMSDRDASIAAIKAMDGSEVHERKLVVHEAKSRPRRANRH